MELKVKEIGHVEPKSKQEVEAELLKKHDEQFAETEQEEVVVEDTMQLSAEEKRNLLLTEELNDSIHLSLFEIKDIDLEFSIENKNNGDKRIFILENSDLLYSSDSTLILKDSEDFFINTYNRTSTFGAQIPVVIWYDSLEWNVNSLSSMGRAELFEENGSVFIREEASSLVTFNWVYKFNKGELITIDSTNSKLD